MSSRIYQYIAGDSHINLKKYPGGALTKELIEVNNRYFGGAMFYKNYQGEWMMLPARHKRGSMSYSVYTLQKKGASGGIEDIKLSSKQEAKKLCDDLSEAMAETIDTYTRYRRSEILSLNKTRWYETDVRDQRKVSPTLYVYDKGWQSAIAVPYEIAYDKGSTQEKDGTSKKALKHYFCQNPWGWQPDRYWGSDEDESTGIRESKLINDPFGLKYEIVCMNSDQEDSKTPATIFTRDYNSPNFWIDKNKIKIYVPTLTNGLTVHEFNEQLGAKYCPIS